VLFEGIDSGRQIILFCHDPTALPFLVQEPAVARRLPQLACTVIGHLHSPSILRVGRCLGGMPELKWFGNTARRLSSALRKAREWSPFRVVLCPSLAGIQLFKDGGYLELSLAMPGADGPRLRRHRLPWQSRVRQAANQPCASAGPPGTAPENPPR
jgi:hypothetical protein